MLCHFGSHLSITVGGDAYRFEVLWPPANIPDVVIIMSNVDSSEENCPISFFPPCKRELRELCDDRVHFYQSLQESELKTAHSVVKQ